MYVAKHFKEDRVAVMHDFKFAALVTFGQDAI
jgi:hypothetical protein